MSLEVMVLEVQDACDEDLVQLWRGGNDQAGTELERRYLAYLLSIMRPSIADLSDAKSCCYACLWKVFDGHFDPTRGSLKVWIRKVALNERNSYFRSHYRIRAHESSFSTLDDGDKNSVEAFPSCSATDPITEICFDELHRLLMEKNAQWAAVWWLRYVEDQSVHEIAEEFDMSTDAINGILARARAFLRQQLAGSPKAQ